ncbi:MAG: DUF1614 domain-containing protein [Candidatus Thermoplasmatota archaeon]|nr:DUF1614 domain-containing protein [Candidatus Thermoplasmatota archaeon]
MDRPIYPPVVLPFLLFLLFFGFLFFFIFASAVNAVFTALGLPPWTAYALFITSLAGSFINIPMKTIEVEEVRYKVDTFLGRLYPVRIVEPASRKTTIAINLGGAIIPIAISSYVLIEKAYGWPSFLLATILMITICYSFARVVPGVGIVMPNFIPPISACFIALFASLLFGCLELAPFVAYFSGVIGTLAGADLLNLKKISKLGARMVSIGGAGTFDGIFITGIFSVLLTTLLV